MRPLNTRERKNLLQTLSDQFGFQGTLPHLFQNAEHKISCFTGDLVETEKLRVDAMGLYFGQFQTDGFSLSMEGCQIVGPFADKGIVHVDETEAAAWLRGVDIPNTSLGYVLLKFGEDFIGCGKATGGKIHNRVPKIRRLDLALTSVAEE